MNGKNRIPTNGGQPLTQSPFDKLESVGLPPGPPSEAASTAAGAVTSSRKVANKNRGRVDITRQTAHRGGKTVTVVGGFVGIGLPEKESLAKAMQLMLKNDTQFYKYFIQNDSFRREVGDIVYALTSQ